jgi:phosphatidylserine/phosphatidylglycerophosphate/cardiolipin synthase-like enzyme
MALKNAIARGIRVVCLVDPYALPEIAKMIRQELKGAEILAIASAPDGPHPLMHAKFLVIDGSHTFITSANFSVAAADSSLETGLWVRNEFVSVQIKDHVDHLWEIGILAEFNAPGR